MSFVAGFIERARKMRFSVQIKEAEFFFQILRAMNYNDIHRDMSMRINEYIYKIVCMEKYIFRYTFYIYIYNV